MKDPTRSHARATAVTVTYTCVTLLAAAAFPPFLLALLLAPRYWRHAQRKAASGHIHTLARASHARTVRGGW